MKVLEIIVDKKPEKCANCIFITISSLRQNAIIKCIVSDNKKIEDLLTILSDCPIKAAEALRDRCDANC